MVKGMEEVSEEFFCAKIKEATLICSPQYGYLLALNRDNPYQFTRFVPPDNCCYFYVEKKHGFVLKLVQNKIVLVMALSF